LTCKTKPQPDILLDLKFSSNDAFNAYQLWGCNCGPAALAACLGSTLAEVRPHLPDFDARRFTNPTMMREALASLGVSIMEGVQEFPSLGLIRIQWHGPWTEPGKNPRWAYRFTHWVAAAFIRGQRHIFDVNGGTQLYHDWKFQTVPKIVKTIKGATGEFSPTHIWELK
jgi:hypothetical protein